MDILPPIHMKNLGVWFMEKYVWNYNMNILNIEWYN